MNMDLDALVRLLESSYPPNKSVLNRVIQVLQRRSSNEKVWSHVLLETRIKALIDARQQVHGTPWGSRARIDALIEQERRSSTATIAPRASAAIIRTTGKKLS